MIKLIRQKFHTAVLGVSAFAFSSMLSGCYVDNGSSSSSSSSISSNSSVSISSSSSSVSVSSSVSSSSSSSVSDGTKFGSGPARSMGYLGCSMSVNVAEGYQMLGGERLWPPIGQYNGQVVQNWANNNDNVWNAFNSAVNQYGTPDAVWVMLCIFNNQVTIEETRQIIANVRQRVPAADIYITGQPLYDNPNSCFLAGNGGPDKTDRIAQEAGNDPALNVTYAGAFGPLSSSENSDGCHANDAGRREIGQQFINWFGD